MFRLQIAMVMASLVGGWILPTVRDDDKPKQPEKVHLTTWQPPRGLAEVESDRETKQEKYQAPPAAASVWADDVDAKLADLRSDVDALKATCANCNCSKPAAGKESTLKEATINSTMAPADVVKALQNLGFKAQGGGQSTVFQSGGSTGTVLSGGSAGSATSYSYSSPVVSYETSSYAAPVVQSGTVYQAYQSAPVYSTPATVYRTGPLGRVRTYSASPTCTVMPDGSTVCR